MGTSVNDLIHVLASVLGFERENGDHVRYVLVIDGKIIARTKFSHSWRGNSQIDASILSMQAKQLHCSSAMLKGLLRGQFGKEDYFKELLQQGYINQYEFKRVCKNTKSDRR
jgi:hypothetical protein